jgi:hypothetical protein
MIIYWVLTWLCATHQLGCTWSQYIVSKVVSHWYFFSGTCTGRKVASSTWGPFCTARDSWWHEIISMGHRPTLEYNKGRYLCCHHSEGQMPTVSMLEPPEWPQHAPIVSVQKRAGCCRGQPSTRMIPITKPLLILHHHLSHEKYHICYSTGWLVNSPSSYAATSQLA